MEVDIMKKVIFLGVLLGLALIWFVFFRNPDKSEESQIEQLRTENNELKQKLEKANEQLRPLEVENETLKGAKIFRCSINFQLKKIKK